MSKNQLIAEIHKFVATIPDYTADDNSWLKYGQKLTYFSADMKKTTGEFDIILSGLWKGIPKTRLRGTMNTFEGSEPEYYVISENLKQFFDVLEEWVIDGFENGRMPLKSQTHNKKKTNTNDDNLFCFGNSITDFAAYRIWKDGDEKNGQSLNDAKRRYIWEFCWKHCDKGQQPHELLDQYVSEALKKTKGNVNQVHVTKDDIKTLIDLVARYSDVPPKDLRERYIRFKSGIGVEVKNIP